MERSSASAPFPRAILNSSPIPALTGREGFTLLELLLVLMVVALAGVFVFPNLDPALQRVKSDGALKRTTSFLDDTRRRSVASGKTLIVTLEGEEERRITVREAGTTEGTVAEMPGPDGAEFLELEPGEGRCFPQGHASGFHLTVGTAGGERVRIDIGSFTGLARIVDERKRP